MTPRERWLAVAALATIFGCEITPPERPTGYGFRSQPDNLAFRWPAERVPVRYWVEAKGAVPAYVDEAIRAWEAQFLYGEYLGTRVVDSAAADVRVYLQGNAPPPAPLSDAPPVAACTGQFTMNVGSNNRVTLPVTVLMSWLPGFTPEQVANCLARVTTHEIGHTLGLLQHSDQAADMMFGAPFGFVQVREPSPRDQAAVVNLYHTAPDVRP